MIEQKLHTLGMTLPLVSTPIANYVPFVISNNLVHISGQLPMLDGKLHYSGKLGETISTEDGQAAARLCALNILAQVKAAIGSLDRVKRCVKITGFVTATAEFTDHSQIINGASDLIVMVFGDNGKHARAAVGVSSLPRGASVEIEAIFEIE